MQAAQRRQEAHSGQLSAADVKKRKELVHLRQDIANKRQCSASGSLAKPLGTTGLTACVSGIPEVVAPSCIMRSARQTSRGVLDPQSKVSHLFPVCAHTCSQYNV